MRPIPAWTEFTLVALLGAAACADTSTPNLMQQQPRYGSTQEDRFVTERARTGAGVEAPVVRGTGQISGGLGSAEVQRTPGSGGGAGRPGVVPFMGGEDQIYYVPTAQAAQYERRATRAAAAGAGRPTTEQVLQFSSALDRAQAHVNARRNGPAVTELERAEQMVLNARTPERPYDDALRDLAAARLAAARGDGRTANAAIDALKSRLRAPA